MAKKKMFMPYPRKFVKLTVRDEKLTKNIDVKKWVKTVEKLINIKYRDLIIQNCEEKLGLLNGSDNGKES